MLENRTIAIRFGAATHRVVVYVNGIEIRQHEVDSYRFKRTSQTLLGLARKMSLALN